MGNRVYGCDICQEVCPWNERFARPTEEEAYRARDGLDGPMLTELAEKLLRINDEGFRELFRSSAIKRAKRAGLLRNVCVALGNWGAAEAVPVLVRALADAEALVRGHAAWALGRVGTAEAREALLEMMREEPDSWVRQEIADAISRESASNSAPRGGRRLKLFLALEPRRYRYMEGSISMVISDTLFAGRPARRACSYTASGLGASYSQ